MANPNERDIARRIYEEIGGSENVNNIINCQTRLRISVKDKNKINDEAVQDIENVMGTVDRETYQIVLGPGLASKVANEMGEMGDVILKEEDAPEEDTDMYESQQEYLEQAAAENKASQKQKYDKDSRMRKILDSIARIFIPLIPALVGAGIIGGVGNIFTNMLEAGQVSGAGWEYFVLVTGIIQDGLFAYLNIFVGINAAKVFKGTEGLGGIIGGVVYLTGAEELALPNIFTGGELEPGAGGVIGVIFAVWLLAVFERQLRKVVPNSVDIIVTSTVSLLVIGLATIFLIMPLAGLVSDSLVGLILGVLEIGGAIAGFVLGTLFLPMVMFGLHHILTPIHLEMIAQTGSTQLLPILAMAGAGQVGAAVALWVRGRGNNRLTNMIKNALPVGILGIGEPLIYAVTLPLGKPFITACLGGGIGGAVVGLFGNVGASTFGPSGLALIPVIVGGEWWIYIIGLLAGYVGGFLVTYFFGIPKEVSDPAVEAL